MGELIVNGIKWAFIIGVSLTLATAIITFLNFIVQLSTTNVIGEVLGIMSNCLPFDMSSVMSGIITALSAILSFLVAQKIYNLTTNNINV